MSPCKPVAEAFPTSVHAGFAVYDIWHAEGVMVDFDEPVGLGRPPASVSFRCPLACSFVYLANYYRISPPPSVFGAMLTP